MMDEREDELEKFMEQWRKKQRRMERVLYGEKTTKSVFDEIAENEDRNEV